MPPALQCRGMETEAERLRQNLERYRRLFNPYGCVTDQQVRNTIKELIAETEERLRAIERRPAEDKTARATGPAGSDGDDPADKPQPSAHDKTA